MSSNKFHFEATVWIYPGNGGWHFVTLPPQLADEVDLKFAGMKKGWGSLPVKVTLANIFWETSIFPDKKQASYILPIKASIRKAANLADGSKAKISIEIKV